jgi:signal transduction histidine kinase
VVQWDRDLPTIVGDAPLIRQAVANYVSNAIKYAPGSGEVTLEAALKGNEVIFTVRDKGPGISTKDQLRLFEKFYRVKTRGNERTKGTGLGLALAKSIAERHGGRAWCESQAGQGSAFYISIPLEIQPRLDGSDQLI